MLLKAYHYIFRRSFAVMLLESFPIWGNAKTFTPMSYLRLRSTAPKAVGIGNMKTVTDIYLKQVAVHQHVILFGDKKASV